jgi:hypothetical protein
LPDWSGDAGPAIVPDAPPTPDSDLSDAPDAGTFDAGELDAAPDAGVDAGTDAGTDAFVTPDAFTAPDAFMAPDAPDAADPDTVCVGGTHCYRLVRTSMTWTSARATCMGMGGDLASIFGAAEQATVWSVAAGMRVWTGGMNNGTSTWSWTDGSPWSSQWGPGEPNLPLAVWAYVSLVPGYGGLWADDQSTLSLPFVCEFP